LSDPLAAIWLKYSVTWRRGIEAIGDATECRQSIGAAMRIPVLQRPDANTPDQHHRIL